MKPSLWVAVNMASVSQYTCIVGSIYSARDIHVTQNGTQRISFVGPLTSIFWILAGLCSSVKGKSNQTVGKNWCNINLFCRKVTLHTTRLKIRKFCVIFNLCLWEVCISKQPVTTKVVIVVRASVYLPSCFGQTGHLQAISTMYEILDRKLSA
jgi:hypothetical protein